MSLRFISVLVLFAAPACADLPLPPVGSLRLGLSSGFGEEHYQLSHASFAIEGAAEITLDSDDAPTDDSLERALPEGDYSVQLRDGWQLERVGANGAELVAAELTSGNPLSFSIATGELTTVTFQFHTLDAGNGPPNGGGDGDVRIAIEVDGEGAPSVIISELMKNPSVLADADGEWLELHNAGSGDIDLGGCTLARDEQDLTIEGSLVIRGGEYLTFANGEAPGFTPDVLYSGLSLPNTGSFVLRLTCGSQLLDQVAVDPAVPVQRAGRSLSLSGSALSPTANDDPSRWCEGAVSYNGDFGTPGAANASCAP
jgi:Lamin Tail Domain